jgi:NAD-dependent SIR2 family protein deacetylase
LLRQWGEAKTHGYFVYTSNVDGHFQFAGYPSDRIVECHGNIHRHQCCEPCHDQVWLDTLSIALPALEALERIEQELSKRKVTGYEAGPCYEVQDCSDG